MTWRHAIAVIGLLGAVGLTGCATKGEVNQLRQRVQELETERDMLRAYLGETGDLRAYLLKLANALCQVEVKEQADVGGLDPAKRICTGTGPGELATPPKYPPK
jgi:outer membrane murein-binding lipoprotein Lpp